MTVLTEDVAGEAGLVECWDIDERSARALEAELFVEKAQFLDTDRYVAVLSRGRTDVKLIGVEKAEVTYTVPIK